MVASKPDDERHMSAPSRLPAPTRAPMLFVGVLIAAVAFASGVWFAGQMDSPHNTAEFEVFWRSWAILEEEFYYEIPAERELIYGATQGLLSAAGDRYTFFVSPQAAVYDRQILAGEFGGIGAYVSQDAEGRLVITALFPGFPAKEAGLRVQDIIEEVNGTSLTGWTLEAAVGQLRGEIGSEALLTVFRPVDGSRMQVRIVRARVELPTVVADSFGSVGYVRLFTFNERAADLLAAEIEALIQGGATGLILDLRGNHGGLLDQAVSVSDLFLAEGVIVTQQDRRGQRTVYRARAGQAAEDIPLAVFIDGGSASASEVVAGALQDHQRAVLIGQTSFGKGLVQHVHDLPGGSQVHVTVALWFTPNQTPIQDQGLAPDIAVEDSTPETGGDPFVEAALQYLEHALGSTEPQVNTPE